LLDVWFINTNIQESRLRLQQDEVAEARWDSRDVLKEMIKNGEFHNYGKEYFDILFEKIDEQMGVTV
jgi:hypothetical protein